MWKESLENFFIYCSFVAYWTFLLCRTTKRYLYFGVNSWIAFSWYDEMSISYKHLLNIIETLYELKIYFMCQRVVMGIYSYPWDPRRDKRFYVQIWSSTRCEYCWYCPWSRKMISFKGRISRGCKRIKCLLKRF